MRPYRHTVQYYETDRMGITHHSNYVRWMEEARIDFMNQLGWNYERFEAEGVVSPVTTVECRYKSSTTFPETISIQVSVESMRGVRLRLNYRMTNESGKTVCEAASEHCFIGQDGRILRMERAYPEFYRALAELAENAEKAESAADRAEGSAEA